MLVLVLAAVMLCATSAGLVVGRRPAGHPEHREPFGVLYGALIGFMGLVLAFGLSLAVRRDECGRADVVEEAQAIGTTYLRAQTLVEPVGTDSPALLWTYADISISLSRTVPGSVADDRAVARSEQERRLWALAGQPLDGAPEASAPRVHGEALNDMLDAQSRRVHGLINRVPTTVLALELAGAAVAALAPCTWPGSAAECRAPRRAAAGDHPAGGHLRPRPARPRADPCRRHRAGRRTHDDDRGHGRRRPAGP